MLPLQAKKVHDSTQESLEGKEKSVEEAKEIIAKLKPGREKTDEYNSLLAERATKRQKLDQMKKQLEEHRENDTEALKELQSVNDLAHLAADRWTDNMWALKSYLVKKRGIDRKEVDKFLGMGCDFDYVP